MSELNGMLEEIVDLNIEKKQIEQSIRAKKEQMAWHIMSNEKAIVEYLVAHASLDSIKRAAHITGRSL